MFKEICKELALGKVQVNVYGVGESHIKVGFDDKVGRFYIQLAINGVEEGVATDKLSLVEEFAGRFEREQREVAQKVVELKAEILKVAMG